jgi:hypothetical protein
VLHTSAEIERQKNAANEEAAEKETAERKEAELAAKAQAELAAKAQAELQAREEAELQAELEDNQWTMGKQAWRRWKPRSKQRGAEKELAQQQAEEQQKQQREQHKLHQEQTFSGCARGEILRNHCSLRKDTGSGALALVLCLS